MSKVIFLSVPSHGNVNPTLGLVSELVQQGEEVVYFSSLEFKDKVEQAGATFKNYAADLDLFKADERGGKGGSMQPMHRVIGQADKIIADILYQINGAHFDYMIHSMAFPFAKVMKQLLRIPSVSSLAIFSGIKKFLGAPGSMPNPKLFPGMEDMLKTYEEVSERINETDSVQMPENVLGLLANKGDINLVYTSEYFISPGDRAVFDDSFKLVGPPIYESKATPDFPFERLEGKKVIYISLGTVFNNMRNDIYALFFKAFAEMDAIVVMAAYNVDLTGVAIPDNFIVRNYVPQSALLKYTDVAITHGGMNSMSDLINSNVPFVSMPLGADQPALAKRAEELGATIILDINNLNAEKLRNAVEQVFADPEYLKNIKKISTSFAEAGGYKKAVAEIFKMKQEKGLLN